MDVVAYVDGFNLYNGVRHKHGHAYLWLDLAALVRRLRVDDELLKVRYFTSIVKGEPDAARRQETYLGALSAHSPEVEVVRGHFKRKRARCYLCNSRFACACDPPRNFQTYEEKHTDVALAVSMIRDAGTRYGDLSLLISTDTDFRPAVQAVLDIAPDRPVMIACPPGREAPKGDYVQPVEAFEIPEKHLRDAQLPDKVEGARGRIYERPGKWAGENPKVA